MMTSPVLSKKNKGESCFYTVAAVPPLPHNINYVACSTISSSPLSYLSFYMIYITSPMASIKR